MTLMLAYQIECKAKGVTDFMNGHECHVRTLCIAVQSNRLIN